MLTLQVVGARNIWWLGELLWRFLYSLCISPMIFNTF